MKRLGRMLVVLIMLVSCQKRKRQNVAFYTNISSEPTSLNILTASDGASSEVRSYVLESMLFVDINSYDWKPGLAYRWETSKDKTKFKFWLKKGIKWHDGVDLTADDVEYTFNAYFDDKKWKNAHKKFSYANIKSVKAIGKYIVEVIVKSKVYSNFDTVASMKIIPKHFYSQDKKRSFFNKNLLGTGPYKLEKWYRGNRVVLIKNEKWWGREDPEENKKWNFPKVVVRWAADATISVEMLKKGKLDYIGMQPEAYVKKAAGPLWGKSVHKVKVKNNTPKSYCFIGMNFKEPLLRDRKVRRALYHLLNRKLMIEKFEYNMSTPAVGPIYPSSPYRDKNLKPVSYNRKKALSLLHEAGWKDSDRDGILDKNGKKLSITLLEPGSYSKYLTVFKEDARKAGVDIVIKKIEWNSFVKLVTQEKKFQMCRLCWSASVDWDPLQIWHSKSITDGSNFISYSNKKVDRLIDLARLEFNRDKRIKILREVERQIVYDTPYLFMMYRDVSLYGYTNRIKREEDTYNYGIGTPFWSFKTEQKIMVE